MFHESRDGITFSVKVIPRAKRDEIVGVEGEAVKIRLNAPPVEGRANEALIKFLAQVLGVARAQVEIVRGDTSRRKVVRVRGVGLAKIKELLKA
ncbi:MAG: YggU family protein [Chloroflexi bacterium]|nr:YggU family protein [Chloroflexota bacterium]